MLWIISILLLLGFGQQQVIPEMLPDNNRDGFSDSYDLLEAFRGSHQNQYEIYEIMYLADKDNDGLISRKEWSSFYKVFLVPFIKDCDKDADLLLNKKEFEDCLKSKPFEAFSKSYDAVKNEKKTEMTMMALSQSIESVNLSHYLFLRRTAFVFKQCINETDANLFISRKEVGDCALTVMMPDHNINTENYLYTVSSFMNLQENTLTEDKGEDSDKKDEKKDDKKSDKKDNVLEQSEELKKTGLSSIGFVTLFYKLNLFNRMSVFKSDLAEQTVMLKELKLSVDNGKLNDTVLTIGDVERIFEGQKMIYLDFKSFYLIQSLAEMMAVFGKESKLDEETFVKLTGEKLFNATVDEYFKGVRDKYEPDEFHKAMLEKEEADGEGGDKKDGDKKDVDKKEEEDPMYKLEKGFMVPGVFLQMRLRDNHRMRDGMKMKMMEGDGDQMKWIFSASDINQDKSLDLKELFNLYQNAFVFMKVAEAAEKKQGKSIVSKDIADKESTYESIVELSKDTKEGLAQMRDFDPELPMNALVWILFMNYKKAFEGLLQRQPEQQDFMDEGILKETLKRWGVPIGEVNFELCKRNTHYDSDRAFKLAVRDYSRFVKEEDAKEKEKE